MFKKYLPHRHFCENGGTLTVTIANAGVYEKIKEACLGGGGEIPAFAGMTGEEEGMTGEEERMTGEEEGMTGEEEEMTREEEGMTREEEEMKGEEEGMKKNL